MELIIGLAVAVLVWSCIFGGLSLSPKFRKGYVEGRFAGRPPEEVKQELAVREKRYQKNLPYVLVAIVIVIFVASLGTMPPHLIATGIGLICIYAFSKRKR